MAYGNLASQSNTYTYVSSIYDCADQLAALSPYEVACVYARLGWLNIYNPCKPEGDRPTYECMLPLKHSPYRTTGTCELDLSRREERVVAKILCTLAVNVCVDTTLSFCVTL